MTTNLKPKLQRFAADLAFACPICGQDLQLKESSLACSSGHSYDLAKLGYVNLAPQARASHNYDRDSFQNRQLILEAGFYQHILDQLLQILAEQPQYGRLLDVGCGEGYYARQIQEKFSDKDLYAFDLSKDSIQLATKSDSSLAVKWFVGDLARLPLQSASMDLILDIFSPANYQEFARVLSPQGLLVKVIPSREHLQEIRHQLAAEQQQTKEYSNQDILNHLKQSFHILESYDISRTFPLQEPEKTALLAMTPLLFHVNWEQMDWSSLKEISIAARIILAQPKQTSK